MPDKTIEVCERCGEDACDGVLFKCTKCNKIMCTTEVTRSYRWYGTRTRARHHLVIEARGQVRRHCGPVEVMVQNDMPTMTNLAERGMTHVMVARIKKRMDRSRILGESCVYIKLGIAKTIVEDEFRRMTKAKTRHAIEETFMPIHIDALEELTEAIRHFGAFRIAIQFQELAVKDHEIHAESVTVGQKLSRLNTLLAQLVEKMGIRVD